MKMNKRIPSSSILLFLLSISLTISAASPTTPSSPSPSNGATNVALSGTLSWSCSANDGGSTLNYDLYMGTSTSNMSLYKSGKNSKSCSYSGLDYGKKYYWKVVVYNGSGGSTQGPFWSFTTKSAPNPTTPSSPSPSSGSTNVALSGTFSWSCSANDGGSTLNYDLYLGTSSSNMSLYKSGRNSTSCSYSGLDYGTKYYWKVVVYNGSGGSTQSSTWNFTTKNPSNPTTPSSPSPSSGATNVATSGTLSWSCSANDGGSTLNYDLYMGTSSSNMSLYKSGRNSTSCSYSGLDYGTKYYWKVVVYNGSGGSTQSSTWNFTTKNPSNPTTPSSPSPSSGATNVATSGTFSWSCSANDGGSTLNYDLYLGTSSSNMTLYKSGKSTSCTYSGLKNNQKYYWKVVVYNGSGGSTQGSVWNFTTKSAPNPTKPTSPSPSSGATNVALSGTFSWSSSSNDGGSTLNYDLYLGTSTSNMQLYKTGKNSTSCSYSGLDGSTKYYWKVIVYNGSGGSIQSDTWNFTTKADPTAPSKPSSPTPANNATNVATSGTFKWSTAANDGGSTLNYDLYLDTNSSFSNVSTPYKKGSGKTCSYSNLKAGTKYYWKVIAYNGSGKHTWSDVWNFTTSSSGEGMVEMDEAIAYLQGKGIVDGSTTTTAKPNDKITRAQMAKVSFLGVYSVKNRTAPSSVPSDNYPTIYSDLSAQNSSNSYYFQGAKALLYLEYGDGVTPFDRDRLSFAPTENIARVHVLKVLMETFNIKPDVTGTNNPFSGDADVTSLASKNPVMMGYIRKAASLGIINTTNSTFRPFDNCLRGEAFTMLARIMKKVDAGSITDPNPVTADYFQPLNITLKTIAMGLSLPMGNFQHYTKTSFALSGTVPLTFTHTYNSYNTTLPEVFYGAKTVNNIQEMYMPLGDGWTHDYHTFITLVGSISDGSARLLVHWGGGKFEVYKSNGSSLVPESNGVYDEMTLDGSELVINTTTQMEYRFSRLSSSGASVFYLKTVKDRNGNTMTLNYANGVNGSKRISSVSDGNRSLSFTYLSNTDLISKVSDPLGRSIKFSYTKNSKTGRYQLTSFTDAKGQVTKFTYGDNSKLSTSKLLEKIQLPKGNYIENDYDANRRLSSTVSGVNGVPTAQTNITVAATYGSSVSTKSTMVVDRGSQSSTYNYTYNGNNAVTKITGNQSLSVTNTYGNSSHPELPTAIKTNSTNVSNITYDAKGNVTKVTVTGDGTLTTTMTYDDMNNLTSVTDPKGYKTTYTYDSKGNLTKISAPESVTTSISVNSKGLPTEVTDPMGVKTQFQYNSVGNLTQTTLPALSISSTASYDKASRLTSFTNELGRTTTFVYDNNDNLTSMTDPASHTTSYEFDKNDNMTSITNAKGGVTSMSYDNATDWLTSVSFGGSTKDFEYNDDGSLSTYTKPDGTSLNYSYDNLGRVTSDGLNSYSYDSKHRLSSISGGGKTISFTYDGFNHITKATYDGYSNTYSYDKNGNRTSVNNTTYTYDKLNRLTSVTFSGKTINYTYRKDSKLLKVTYPNGMTTEYGYDAIGRLTSKKTKLGSGTVVASYTFTLDKVGNITKQTKTEPYGDIALTNGETNYTYNSANRITKAGSVSFTFDANGNTTKRGSEAYKWDKQDRLSQAGSTNITYDPLGLIASYGSTTFTTDPLGMGNVLSDSKSGAEYIYGNGLEARVKNGKVSYYVSDVRGSVVAIVDDNGKITHKYQYDEYGKVTQKTEADYNPFQFVGKYGVMYLTDHLYYMRARHYDPTIGRFLSEDPVWSTNLYPYADDNPIMRIDPKGTAGIEILTPGLLEGLASLKSGVIDKVIEGLGRKITTTYGAASAWGKAMELAALAEMKAIEEISVATFTKTELYALKELIQNTSVVTEESKAALAALKSAITTSETAGGAGAAGGAVTLPATLVVSIVAIVVVDVTWNVAAGWGATDVHDFFNRLDKNGSWIYKGSQKIGQAFENFWDWSLGWAIK